ncbi:MAG: hypothetical protein OCD03_02940 [Hyphomicrobiales bacterium]
MNNITKTIIAMGTLMTVGVSVAPTYADSFDDCMSRNYDWPGCVLSDWFGGAYIAPPIGASDDKIISRLKDLQKAEMLRPSTNKMAMGSGKTYKATCSANRVVDMIEKKSSPKQVLSVCYKQVKTMKAKAVLKKK